MLFKNLIMKLGEDSKLETMKLWWNYETWRRLQKSIKRATTMIVLDKEGSKNDCNLLVSTMNYLSIFWASSFSLFVSLREECFVMKYHWLFTEWSRSFSSDVWLAGSRRLGATSCDGTLTTTGIKCRWFYRIVRSTRQLTLKITSSLPSETCNGSSTNIWINRSTVASTQPFSQKRRCGWVNGSQVYRTYKQK